MAAVQLPRSRMHPEVVLVTLTERLGIGRDLPHIMVEGDQFASDMVRRHPSLDPDQALWNIPQPAPNPAASNLLTQNNRPLLIQAD